MVDPALRRLLAEVHGAGVRAARGEELLRRHAGFDGEVFRYRHGDLAIDWPIPRDGRLLVVGAGKAAASLARGLEAVLGDRIEGGLIVVKHGHGEPLARIGQAEGGHPTPDEGGARGTAALLARVRHLAPRDRVIVALTGGASALLVAPAPPLTVADEAETGRLLVASGAPIEEINAVRSRLSRIKGGGLAAAIAPAVSLTLAISDVPSRDLAVIGSGPTVAPGAEGIDAREVIARHGLSDALPPAVRALLAAPARPARGLDPGRHRHLILADQHTALAGAAARAEMLGWRVELLGAAVTGGTHDAARAFAAALEARNDRRTILLAAGETTLAARGGGRGGRNQEYALVAATALAGAAGTALLAAGTDGTDGPTAAAGAFADGATVAEAARRGIDVAACLADNDSFSLFEALGDLHVTGPTGTNVMDLVVGVAE